MSDTPLSDAVVQRKVIKGHFVYVRLDDCRKIERRLRAEIANLRIQLRDAELLMVENEQLKEQLAALKAGYVMHAILSGAT